MQLYVSQRPMQDQCLEQCEIPFGQEIDMPDPHVKPRRLIPRNPQSQDG